MRISPDELRTLIRQSINGWIEDRAPSMGAALAYYTAFSLAPLLLIVIAVAGLVFGEDAARGAILDELSELVGADGAAAILAMLAGLDGKKEGIFAAVVSAVTLFIGATTAFVELQSDLDRIWKVETRTAGGVWGFLRTRLLSFGMVLGIGFLLLVSLVISAFVSTLEKFWGGWFVGVELLLQASNFLVSFGVITVLFAMIYKILPSVDIEWDDVWIGALVTSLLFSVGKFLIGLYIGKSAVSSSLGASGTFVVLLLWLYYSTQIFLLGAEFTYAYAHGRGSHAGANRLPRQELPWQE